MAAQLMARRPTPKTTKAFLFASSMEMIKPPQTPLHEKGIGIEFQEKPVHGLLEILNQFPGIYEKTPPSPPKDHASSPTGLFLGY